MAVMAVYRLRQGLRALFAFTQPVDLELAEQTLTPALLDLFRRMDRGEQLHSLLVLRDVLADGDAPPELKAAALLHDVGKSRYPIGVWQKTLAVAVQTLRPRLYARLSQGVVSNPIQRPFVVYVQHPRWGAQMAADAGGSEALVWLIAHHADPLSQWQGHPYQGMLERLQRADNAH